MERGRVITALYWVATAVSLFGIAFVIYLFSTIGAIGHLRYFTPGSTALKTFSLGMGIALSLFFIGVSIIVIGAFMFRSLLGSAVGQILIIVSDKGKTDGGTYHGIAKFSGIKVKIRSKDSLASGYRVRITDYSRPMSFGDQFYNLVGEVVERDTISGDSATG